MKLTFFWRESNGWFAPWCESGPGGNNSNNIIDIFLLMNGGSRPVDEIAAFSSMIEQVDAVASGGVDSDVLYRYAATAELKDGVATVTDHMDDGLRPQRFGLDDFRRMLLSWREFLSMGPKGHSEVRLEIAEL